VKPALLAVALAIVTLGVPSVPSRAESERVPARLTVTARRGVPDLERQLVERAILRRLEARNCGLRLPRPDEAPAWTIQVELLSWREQEGPGGQPVFDPSRGIYLPGRRRDIEAEYTLRVVRGAELPPPDGTPLRPQTVRAHAETTPHITWEPRVEASRILREDLAEEVRRAVCKAVRD
jgi:hypothetical protein